MEPGIDERNGLLKGLARALFKRDMDALYRVVTPDFLWSYHDGVSVAKWLAGPDAIARHLLDQADTYAAQRFHDTVYHHLPDLTFMTMRVSETVRATGEKREQTGIERYTFSEGRIAMKDVYRKPIVTAALKRIY